MARTRTSAALAAACLAVLAVGTPARAAVSQPPGEKPAFDARGSGPLGSPSATERAAQRSLQAQLGAQATVAASPAAITVSSSGALLTPPSSDDPAAIALDYVRAH